jgi:hypothetical protein
MPEHTPDHSPRSTMLTAAGFGCVVFRVGVIHGCLKGKEGLVEVGGGSSCMGGCEAVGVGGDGLTTAGVVNSTDTS